MSRYASTLVVSAALLLSGCTESGALAPPVQAPPEPSPPAVVDSITISGTISRGWFPRPAGSSAEGERLVGIRVEADGRATTTNADGHYAISIPKDRRTSLTVSADDWSTVQVSMRFHGDTVAHFALSRRVRQRTRAEFVFPHSAGIHAIYGVPGYHHSIQRGAVRARAETYPWAMAHAEHLSHVRRFFQDLYGHDGPGRIDAYYTTEMVGGFWDRLAHYCGLQDHTTYPQVFRMAECHFEEDGFTTWVIAVPPFADDVFDMHLRQASLLLMDYTQPAWLRYGTALYFESARIASDSTLFVEGEPARDCLRNLHYMGSRLLSLNQLLVSSGDVGETPHPGDEATFYAQSCLLVHHLERQHGGAVYRLLMGDTLERTTGRSLQSLDQDWRQYVKKVCPPHLCASS